MEYNLSHSQLRPLLRKLHDHECFHNHIPKDPRTLLGTPDGKTSVENIFPGLYYHFGLRKEIINVFQKHANKSIEKVILKIGFDGVPISKSSQAQFWPILGCVEPFSDIFLVGAYFGYEKPHLAEDFLEHFLNETENLCINGLEFEGNALQCQIKCIIANTPAKSFILNIKGHTGYYSCTRCRIKGKYKVHRVCFLHKRRRLKKRTDANIRYMQDKKHQLGRCCLR